MASLEGDKTSNGVGRGLARGLAPLAASLAPVLAALAASAVLIVEYTRNEAVFCSEGGGCSAVRRSAIASAFGAALPELGLLGFLALGAASLGAGRVARWAQVVLAGIAGVVGCALLFAQAQLGAFCVYCTVADASALVAFAVALWRLRLPSEPPVPWLVRAGGGVAIAIVAALPLVVGMAMKARVPQVILAEIARTPPGQVTVVDFVDFECPYCRETHALLAPLLASHRDRVRLVRLQVPLRSHPHAHDAALAAVCGEALGRGEPMADALFAARVETLTRDGCAKIAETLGLPRDAYRACVADPKTDARLDADRAVFDAAGSGALPTLWIDEQRLVGAQPGAVLADALGAALAKDQAAH